AGQIAAMGQARYERDHLRRAGSRARKEQGAGAQEADPRGTCLEREKNGKAAKNGKARAEKQTPGEACRVAGGRGGGSAWPNCLNSVVPRRGLEPPHLAAHGPEPCASTNSATWALSQTLQICMIRCKTASNVLHALPYWSSNRSCCSDQPWADHRSERLYTGFPTLAKRSNKDSNNNNNGRSGFVLPETPPDFDPDVPSREAILATLRSAGAPLSPVELAERMDVLRPETLVGFERRLAAMERDGQLMPNRKGVLLLATKLDFVAGKVQGHRDGFGFLLRDDGGPDLFLSPREMLKVLHGDRVLVKPSGEYRGKPEGTIVEVIERRTNKLVGRFLHEHGLSIVVPEDQRIKHDILIPPGDTNGAQHGQVVSVQIIEQPTRHTQPLGR